MAWGIFIPWARIKPTPSALEAWSRNHWTTGKSLCLLLNHWVSLLSRSTSVDALNTKKEGKEEGGINTPFVNRSITVSVQFSHSVVSDSLGTHELQYARPPCPSPTHEVHSNSCPSSWWCHPAISSSVVSFSSCPQFLPASGSFPMSQLFAWGGRSIGVSALASVLPKNTQDWSPGTVISLLGKSKQRNKCSKNNNRF